MKVYTSTDTHSIIATECIRIPKLTTTKGKYLEEVIEVLLPTPLITETLITERYINLLTKKMERSWKYNCTRYRKNNSTHNLVAGTLPEDVASYIVDRLLRKFLPIVQREEQERWENAIGEVTARELREAPEDSHVYSDGSDSE